MRRPEGTSGVIGWSAGSDELESTTLPSHRTLIEALNQSIPTEAAAGVCARVSPDFRVVKSEEGPARVPHETPFE